MGRKQTKFIIKLVIKTTVVRINYKCTLTKLLDGST
jgi:hypothetical protein